MMARKVVLTGLIVAVGVCAHGVIHSDAEDRERGIGVEPERPNAVDRLKTDGDRMAQGRLTEKLPITQARGRCPPLLGARVPVTPEQDMKVLSGMRALIAKNADLSTVVQLTQQGDPSAALVLFQRVRPCSETTRHLDSMEFEAPDVSGLSQTECAQLPAAVLHNPISILTRAADGGSTAAKILVMKNAPTVASVMAMAGDASAQEISELRVIAENHGLDAARSGSESALAWLAHSYLVGSFGQKDAASAYAIMQGTMRSGSVEHRERLEFLHSQLLASELDTARSILNRCNDTAQTGYSSIFLSPFN